VDRCWCYHIVREQEIRGYLVVGLVVNNNIDNIASTGGNADYVGDAQRALDPIRLVRSALRSIPAHIVTDFYFFKIESN